MSQANIPRIGQQLTFPGMSPADMDPKPENFEDAYQWLRENCKCKLVFNEDVDVLQVTLVARNTDADKRTFFAELDVPPNNLEGASAAILRLVRDAHAFKHRMEAGEALAS